MVCTMLIVVRQGDKYGPEYPQILKRMAKETSNLDTLILGDGEDADIKLIHGWEGWWAKMELYRPDLPRPFIYVDLDSTINEDISDLLLLKGRWISKEWHPNVKGCGKYQSSCMVIEENPTDIWEIFIENPRKWMGQYYGDQKFIERFEWNTFDVVGSYQFHDKDEPKHWITTFHGKPKPHQIQDGWVKEVWHD